MRKVDPNIVAAIIRETAEAVILPRFRQLHSDEIREKKPGDLVTVADLEAEALLTQRLTDLLPGSLVVGEEAVAADASVLDRLLGDDPVWIIDPVDGTSNFAHGRVKFGVIVALVHKKQTIQGWIHNPLEQQTAIAELGSGAFMGEARLRVAADAPLEAMIGTVGSRKNAPLGHAVSRLIRNGSAAHDYLDLAQGRIHFATYQILRPWDHAAGVLIHGEAGGYSALVTRQPYRPRFCEDRLLMAPNQDAWNRLMPLAG